MANSAIRKTAENMHDAGALVVGFTYPGVRFRIPRSQVNTLMYYE
jgi:hypothetical protein